MDLANLEDFFLVLESRTAGKNIILFNKNKELSEILTEDH